MKIYFTASSRGLDDLGNCYKLIYDTIEELGHTNLDDLVFNPTSVKSFQENQEENLRLYQRTMKQIKASDLVVLEVSVNSLSMGFVLERALESGKPVILLYMGDRYPFFAAGIDNDKLQVLEYDRDNLKSVLRDALEYAKDASDTRFNFFISPRHINYLDWIAKNRKIPRSVYLRDLIQKDMGLNDEFQKAA